ncbi:MAG: FISUMP domain-containing protein, partial [Candidatus Gracilibacteria bacterium]|nr:FISUMP domain-containing protein [Candidatus Gracilibacteria bacterium]
NTQSMAISNGTCSQSWNGSSRGACTSGTCNTNYTWNGTSCIANTQTYTCGAKPSNTSWNTVSSYTQARDGSVWVPAGITTVYNTTADTTSCRYVCISLYHTEDSGVSCKSNTQSIAISNGTCSQSWNGSSRGACTSWSCNSGYHSESSSCMSNTKQVSCTQAGGVTNSTYTVANVTVTWNGSSRPAGANCSRSCNSGYHLESGSCLANTQSMAISNGTCSQSWNGSSRGACTSGTCNTNYTWNGTSCIITSCTTGISEITLSNGQTWSCMNLGTTAVRDGITQPTNCGGSATNCNSLTGLGDYYQWGRSGTGWTNGNTSSPYNYGWESQNDNKWGGSSTTATGGIYSVLSTANKALMQGPCPSGRHVPTAYEWQLACNTITSTTCTNGMANNGLISSKLKIPFAGFRGRNDGAYYGQNSNAVYWSSTPTSSYALYLNFNGGSMRPTNINYRAYGFSVRCIKN